MARLRTIRVSCRPLIAHSRKTFEVEIPPILPAIESRRLSQNENGKAFRGHAKRGEARCAMTSDDDSCPVNVGFWEGF